MSQTFGVHVVAFGSLRESGVTEGNTDRPRQGRTAAATSAPGPPPPAPFLAGAVRPIPPHTVSLFPEPWSESVRSPSRTLFAQITVVEYGPVALEGEGGRRFPCRIRPTVITLRRRCGNSWSTGPAAPRLRVHKQVIILTWMSVETGGMFARCAPKKACRGHLVLPFGVPRARRNLAFGAPLLCENRNNDPAGHGVP